MSETGKIVSAFFSEHQNSWIVALDELEGTIKAEQWANLTKEGIRSGPFRVKSVEFADVSISKRISFPAVVLAARKNDALERFVGGTIMVSATPPQSLSRYP